MQGGSSEMCDTQHSNTSEGPICVFTHQVPGVHISKPGSSSAPQMAELSGHTAQGQVLIILVQNGASLGRKPVFMVLSWMGLMALDEPSKVPPHSLLIFLYKIGEQKSTQLFGHCVTYKIYTLTW